MRFLILLLFMAPTTAAHSISVSSSQAALSPNRLDLDLTMPTYEAEHLPRPYKLSPYFNFAGLQLLQESCDIIGQELRCRLAYQGPIGESIHTSVSLARATVPNHVHILRFTRAGLNLRQAVFDRSFESEQVDLHQPTAAETWWKGLRLGASQVLFQPLLLLLLLTMGLLQRPTSYALAATLAFLVVLPDRFYATPGFFELATAVTLAYLGAEYLLFPQAKQRWAIFALVGLLEGAGLAVLARPSGSSAFPFATGNLLTQLALSHLPLLFSRNLNPPQLRIYFAAITSIGVLWSIWVFVKRF